MEITLDLTGVIALVGAFTGIFALVWQISTWRRSQHLVRVSVGTSWLTYGSSLGPAMLAVTAANIGSSSVTVTSWGVSTGRKQDDITTLEQFAPSPRLPHRLESGSDVCFYMPLESVRSLAAKRQLSPNQLRCWVRLATGQRMYARKRGIPSAG